MGNPILKDRSYAAPRMEPPRFDLPPVSYHNEVQAKRKGHYALIPLTDLGMIEDELEARHRFHPQVESVPHVRLPIEADGTITIPHFLRDVPLIPYAQLNRMVRKAQPLEERVSVNVPEPSEESTQEYGLPQAILTHHRALNNQRETAKQAELAQGAVYRFERKGKVVVMTIESMTGEVMYTTPITDAQEHQYPIIALDATKLSAFDKLELLHQFPNAKMDVMRGVDGATYRRLRIAYLESKVEEDPGVADELGDFGVEYVLRPHDLTGMTLTVRSKGGKELARYTIRNTDLKQLARALDRFENIDRIIYEEDPALNSENMRQRNYRAIAQGFSMVSLRPHQYINIPASVHNGRMLAEIIQTGEKRRERESTPLDSRKVITGVKLKRRAERNEKKQTPRVEREKGVVPEIVKAINIDREERRGKKGLHPLLKKLKEKTQEESQEEEPPEDPIDPRLRAAIEEDNKQVLYEGKIHPKLAAKLRETSLQEAKRNFERRKKGL